MRHYAIAALLAVLGFAVPAATVYAADIAIQSAPASPAEAEAAARHHVSQRAALHMLRAIYGVVASDDLPRLIAADVEAAGASGPTEQATRQLQRDLIAEASYHLISLRYLAESGGANWPRDRAEALYVNDALVTVDALLDRLLDAVDSGADVLPVLREADVLYALTEGVTTVEGDLDHFAGRDDLVEAAFEQAGARSTT